MHLIKANLFSLILVDRKSYQHSSQKEWPQFFNVFFSLGIKSSSQAGQFVLLIEPFEFFNLLLFSKKLFLMIDSFKSSLRLLSI